MYFISCSENQTIKVAKSYEAWFEALAMSFWFNLGSIVQFSFLHNNSVHNFYKMVQFKSSLVQQFNMY